MDQKSDHHHHHFFLNKQQLNPSSSSPQNPNKVDHHATVTPAPAESPRVIISSCSERVKRDEWSEGAVSSLLDAYEAKWTLRNRAKLKGHDWEDVARHVSARASGSRSAKTQTQCKNKIESMKKRYRSESSATEAVAASSWPLYPRLDLLVRGNSAGSNPPPPTPVAVVGLGLQPQAGQAIHNQNTNDGSNNGAKPTNQEEEEEKEKNPINKEGDDSSTPAVDEEFSGRMKKRRMTRSREEWWAAGIGESIRWAAEVVVRSEEARMETMREIERMRAEADAKRGEMELKRTEIIANAQLQIAKLFAKT